MLRAKQTDNGQPAGPRGNGNDRLSFWEIVKSDGPASFVVFLVALPLGMGIAIASGAPVAAGLITGIVGGLVVGLLAGSPLQVSGPAAGLTVIVFQVILTLGLPLLGLVVLIAGFLQFVAGVFKLGQWFRAVSPAVIKGMLAGIGVLIFAGQFHVMVDDRVQGSGIQNLITIPQAVVKGLSMPPWGSEAERKMLRNKLVVIGELQRQQLSLEQTLAEFAPAEASEALAPHEAGKPAPETVPHLILEPETPEMELVIARQRQIVKDLEASIARLEAIPSEFHSQQKAEQIRAAANHALATSRGALQQLQIEGGTLAQALTAQAEAVDSLAVWQDKMKNHSWAAAIGLLTIIIILAWQGLAPKRFKIIPGPLLGVVVATTLAAVLALPVLYVTIPSDLFRDLHVFHFSAFSNTPWAAVIQSAFVIAVVASAETLLCAAAVDQLHTGPRTRYDKELAAQGVGNMVCGFLGALPMTGVIVRSSANLQAGGRTRWSAVMHGLWLLVFVSWLTWLLRYIPTSSLAAILVYTGYKLIDIKAIKKLAHYGKAEVGIYFATLVTIVGWDLLTGVIVGVVLSGVRLLHTFSRLEAELELDDDQQTATLRLRGAATFVGLPKLAKAIEQVPNVTELHVDISQLQYIDHACLDLIMNWSKQHESSGGQLQIDWDGMHAKFREKGRNTRPAAHSPAEDGNAGNGSPENHRRPENRRDSVEQSSSR